MKGVFLQQQLEFRLEVSGTEWSQGEPVPCILSIINHGAVTQSVNDLYLRLVLGDNKSLKNQVVGAFQPVAAAELAAAVAVDPQKQQSFPWTFQLEKDCVITDKSQGFYLLYGAGTAWESLGRLPLPILPHRHIQAVLRILETTFKFVVKGCKSAKGWVEVKLKPPAGKKFAALEQLLLYARCDGDDLFLKYVFRVQEFSASSSALVMQKGKKEVEQRHNSGQYLFPGGQINREPLQQALEEALKQVGSAF